MARHKHYDLIVAWAEGREIEAYSQLDKHWFLVREPIWSETTNYRIKPEPKPDAVWYATVELEKGTALSWLSIQNTGTLRITSDNVKLTFDGETGKLKSAEVLDV